MKIPMPPWQYVWRVGAIGWLISSGWTATACLAIGCLSVVFFGTLEELEELDDIREREQSRA